jgi:hypothetical protein
MSNVSTPSNSPAGAGALWEVPFLDPAKVRLRLDSSGYLEGTADGTQQLAELRARAAFPFTLPDQFIELRNSKGELLGFVRRLDELDAGSGEAIGKAARLQHFTPLVRRILSVRGKRGLFIWRVVTDRGEAEFSTRGRRQNIEEIAGDEYIVTDIDGNRYRIPRVPELDARSLLHLRKVL